MEKLQEILIITQEECAEVVQAISKCFRFGNEGVLCPELETNRCKVEKEIGDLLAMIDLLVEHKFLDADHLHLAKEAKIKKLKRWSTIFS